VEWERIREQEGERKGRGMGEDFARGRGEEWRGLGESKKRGRGEEWKNAVIPAFVGVPPVTGVPAVANVRCYTKKISVAHLCLQTHIHNPCSRVRTQPTGTGKRDS
jgi:hypothetical protein